VFRPMLARGPDRSVRSHAIARMRPSWHALHCMRQASQTPWCKGAWAGQRIWPVRAWSRHALPDASRRSSNAPWDQDCTPPPFPPPTLKAPRPWCVPVRLICYCLCTQRSPRMLPSVSLPLPPSISASVPASLPPSLSASVPASLSASPCPTLPLSPPPMCSCALARTRCWLYTVGQQPGCLRHLPHSPGACSSACSAGGPVMGCLQARHLGMALKKPASPACRPPLPACRRRSCQIQHTQSGMRGVCVYVCVCMCVCLCVYMHVRSCARIWSGTQKC